jgi:hypothetical protein
VIFNNSTNFNKRNAWCVYNYCQRPYFVICIFYKNYYDYIRPPLVQWTSGLIIGVASLGGQFGITFVYVILLYRVTLFLPLWWWSTIQPISTKQTTAMFSDQRPYYVPCIYSKILLILYHVTPGVASLGGQFGITFVYVIL